MRWLQGVAAAVLVSVSSGGDPLGAQAPKQTAPPPVDPWFVKQPAQTLKVRAYVDPSKRFTLEYPAKDWTAYPGGITSLVLLHQKKGHASVVVERTTLPVAAEQRFVNDLYLSLRAEELQNAEPQSSAIEQRVIEDGEFRIAVLVYSRPGISSHESLRIYHMLRGRHLYRVICRAAQGQMPQFEAVFAHIAASFSAPVVT
jgi:hypothetical protein